MSGLPVYETREPENDPELLAAVPHENGLTDGSGPILCGVAHCGKPAQYACEYSDHSTLYACREHGMRARRGATILPRSCRAST